MLLHHRTIGFSRARTLVLPCFLTLQLTPCAIAHLIPTHSPSSPYSLPITLPTHIPSLSLCTFHPFVVTTLALSNSIHVFFHGVRETGLFTHVRATLNFTIISMWHPRCRSAISIRCLAGMCHAPSPPHHRLLPRAKSCLAQFPTPRLPPCATPHLIPDTLSILTRLAFHLSPAALSIPLSSPHRPSPNLSSFPTTTCVLKRFSLTSPRKLPLPCVKRGFLRTPEPHRTS